MFTTTSPAPTAVASRSAESPVIARAIPEEKDIPRNAQEWLMVELGAMAKLKTGVSVPTAGAEFLLYIFTKRHDAVVFDICIQATLPPRVLTEVAFVLAAETSVNLFGEPTF